MNHLLFIPVVLWTCLGFALYYYLSRLESPAIAVSRWFPRAGREVIRVLLQRLWGVLFLGVIPALVILCTKDSARNFRFIFTFTAPPPWWSYVFLGVMIVAGFIRSRSENCQALYPQIREVRWTVKLLSVNALSWIFFLAAYEFLFRGLLLFALLTALDEWPAVIVNSSIYAFAHFYKGPGETFGSIPGGIVLCWATLMTGNIWTAVIIHSVMALALEWFSIQRNPDMSFIGAKR